MSSSAEEAIPILRTWVAGNTPLRFTLAIGSVATVRAKARLSPDTDDGTVVLEGEGELRVHIFLRSVTDFALLALPTGGWSLDFTLPLGRLSVFESPE